MDYNKSLSIYHSIFEINRAKYFGDVIYMDTNKQLNKNYTLSITDSKFLNNQAEVAGGVIFFVIY